MSTARSVRGGIRCITVVILVTRGEPNPHSCLVSNSWLTESTRGSALRKARHRQVISGQRLVAPALLRPLDRLSWSRPRFEVASALALWLSSTLRQPSQRRAAIALIQHASVAGKTCQGRKMFSILQFYGESTSDEYLYPTGVLIDSLRAVGDSDPVGVTGEIAQDDTRPSARRRGTLARGVSTRRPPSDPFFIVPLVVAPHRLGQAPIGSLNAAAHAGA